MPCWSPGVVTFTGLFQLYFVPTGRSWLLDTPLWALGCFPASVITCWLFGVYKSASVPTFTVTGNSSWLPSGYITSTVPCWSPGVVTFTGVFQLYFVPAGRSVLFETPALASGCLPKSVFTTWLWGSYLSASDITFFNSFTCFLSEVGAKTDTGTESSSLEPSGYITTTVPCFSPGVDTSTGFSQLYSVSTGRSALFDTPLLAAGSLFNSVFTCWPFGVYNSASVPTFTCTGNSSWLPSGYVTTTVPCFSPGVDTSTGFFQLYLVSSGNSELFFTPLLASGTLPNFVVTAWLCGAYFSASVIIFTGFLSETGAKTVTFTGNSSWLPSG